VVDAAVKVAASELATKAADRYGFMDLEQLAMVAELDDPDTVKALVVAAKDGQFDHAAATSAG
jgi:ParB family chromosome partitioning protein